MRGMAMTPIVKRRAQITFMPNTIRTGNSQLHTSKDPDHFHDEYNQNWQFANSRKESTNIFVSHYTQDTEDGHFENARYGQGSSCTTKKRSSGFFFDSSHHSGQ